MFAFITTPSSLGITALGGLKQSTALSWLSYLPSPTPAFSASYSHDHLARWEAVPLNVMSNIPRYNPNRKIVCSQIGAIVSFQTH